MIEQFELQSHIEVQTSERSIRRLARFVANALTGVGLSHFEPPDQKLDAALDYFARNIPMIIPEESLRNQVGRQIFRNVESVKEILPDYEGTSLVTLSRSWLERTFPGRMERWQKEVQAHAQKVQLRPRS